MSAAEHTAWRPLNFLNEKLELRKAADQYREPPAAPHPRPSFCSNDYLGFADEPAAATSAQGTHEAGAGASRLVAGERAAHSKLEHALSEWLRYPGVLTFTGGYAANVGTLSALLEPKDIVFSDALNHASLVDGMRLSRAQVRVFAHNDLADLERQLSSTSRAERNQATDSVHSTPNPNAAKDSGPCRRWVIVESYYSMDADSPHLRQLRALCDQFGAYLIVDEAHALGMFGPGGRGLCAEAGIWPDIFLGTLGKSLGAAGGFVAGAPELRTYLWNFARSFIYSTGIAPVVAAIAASNVARVRDAGAGRAHAHRRANELRDALRSAGYQGELGHGPIVPWIVGDESRALAYADELTELGFHVRALRPPTVPAGTSRIRFVLTAAHQDTMCHQLCQHVKRMQTASNER